MFKKKKKCNKPDATNKKGKNKPKKKKEKEAARSGYQHQKRSGRLSGHLHFDGYWWCRVVRGQLNPDQLNATVDGCAYGGATVVPSVVVRRWCCRGLLLLRCCCCCSWCSTCDTHKNQRVCKSTSIKRFWSWSAATWPTYTNTHTHTRTSLTVDQITISD